MRSFLQKQPQAPRFSHVARSNAAASQSHRHPVPNYGHDLGALPVYAVYGNAPKSILGKLAISTPGDRAEQEADVVADKVMRQQPGWQGRGTAAGTEGTASRRESALEALHGGGSPLPNPLRAFFEARFQHNFAAVRVHTDAGAARLARGVNARAFTLGPNIVLGAGAYAPGTGEGKHLLAHELAHVVQQERGQPYIQRLTITPRGRPFQGKCGAYEVRWGFHLDKPAPEDGFLVQQIDRNEWIGDCHAQGAPAPLRSYWEAWFVAKGRRKDSGTIATRYTDSSGLATTQPATSGMLSSTGTVKFFPLSTTGDLEAAWKAHEPGWGWFFPPVGKVPESGDLPSTDVQPTWWNNTPVEGPAVRSATAGWNCCDADETKHTTNVTASP
jgi:hypothetical protein